jgi:type IV secretion system protein VirB10
VSIEREDRTEPTADRGIAAAYRARSLESRATSVLALGVMGVLTFVLLAWYYGAALRRPARAAESARARAASRAQSEMSLPALPVLEESHMAQQAESGTATSAETIRPPMPLPEPALLPYRARASVPATAGAARPAAAHPAHPALDRQLAGPPFAKQSDPSAPPEGASAGPAASGEPAPPGRDQREEAGPPGDVARWLVPAATPAVAARVLPTRRLLLPKGAFIDCTLETAIDSTLPGMTTCITATDTFGADGTVVLIERGSKLVGETRGEVQQGSARVFVLWTEARTPTGVVIPVSSPGTDELGRSGLPGSVDRHFFARFGAALLLSVIDGGAQVAAQSKGGTVILGPAASQDVASEVLKDTLRIPPTVVKHQGDSIQVLVARDIDFRSVYELRIATPGR